MAKRSDFAQKLLDDLRLRKEQMAASQCSTGSKQMNRDAFSYSKQTHRGSREPKTHQMNGFRNGSAQGRSSRDYKLYVEDASREIVPYGGGHSSERIGDLSMALAIAFQNEGKHTRMDSSGNNSMFSFINQVGRRSVDLSMMERSGFGRHDNSSRQFPTFSNLHIEDIAKGAQRLNQILRACSNGPNFDRYSIEIGKELLKGALDLEESLRMLVNLQEASDYMITPQRKSRITLLDEEEDENDDAINTAEQKQLDLPIFSFDKHSRNSRHIQEFAMSDLKQRLMALSYLSKAANLNHNAQASSTSNSVSHKRSTSYGSSIKTSSANSDRKNLTSSSKSKPDNGRIPNVIAKLMGLEEVPQGDLKNITPNVSSSKQKADGIAVKKIPTGSSTINQKKKGAENVSSQTKRQVKAQPNQSLTIQATTYAKQTEKNQATYHASFEGNNHEVLPLKKDVVATKQIRGSNKAHTISEKYQNNAAELKQNIQSQKDILENRRQEDAVKLREQKRKEKVETKELALRLHQQHSAPKPQKASESATALRRQTKNTSIVLREDKEESHNPPVNHQLKSPTDRTDQQLYMLQNFDTQNLENQAAKTELMVAKHSTQVRRQKESEAVSRIAANLMHDEANMRRKHLQVDQATTSSKALTESIVAMKSNGSPTNREDPSIRRANNSNINMQDSTNQDSSQIFSAKSEIRKVKISTPPAMKEKSVHLLTAKKVKNTKIQNRESPRKMVEVRNRSGIPKHLSKPLSNQFSISQDVEQINQDKRDVSKDDAHVRISMCKEVEEISRCKEAEADNSGPDKLEAGSQQPKMVEENVNGVQKSSKLYNHPETVLSECQHKEEPETQDLNESCQNKISTVPKDHHGEDFGKDKLQHHNILLDQLNETYDGDKNITLPSQLEKQNIPRLPEALTESENQLKKILTENQKFLDAAEAFFNLTIPLDIFHASSDCPDEETKLVQDCGYEITRRSGKIQELSIHPFMSEFIAPLKVNSLDELIKVLNKDLETLKFYGRNSIGNLECPVEEYLPKMLDSDVHNKDPRVNCMWDIGWDKMMFSFEGKDSAIRDVEKHLLNGLLDDVTRDLLLVC